jgi:hypothetical protein
MQRSLWWEYHDYRAHYPLVQVLGGGVEPGDAPPATLLYEGVGYDYVQHLQRDDIQAAPTAVYCDWESGLQLWSAGRPERDEASSLRHAARSGVEPDCYCHLVLDPEFSISIVKYSGTKVKYRDYLRVKIETFF